MFTVVAVVVIGAIASGVAALLRRRDVDHPDQGASWAIPSHVDRRDFARPDAPWAVLVFSSKTCLACQGTWEKAQILESEAVSVQQVEAVDQKDIHDRYGIEAVPMVLIADVAGLVQRSFVGPLTATDLWAAVAELREPGSVPEPCTGEANCSTKPETA